MNMNKTSSHWMSALGATLIALGVVAGRFLSQDANFTPVIALALLSGYLFRNAWGFAGLLAGMLVSDLLLPFDSLAMRTLVYSALALSVGFGMLLPALRSTERPTLKTEFRFAGFSFAGGLAGAVFFYLLTNAGVWAWSGMYAGTPEGLAQCYINALPFFRNTLFSTLLYGVIFLGVARTLQGTILHPSGIQAQAGREGYSRSE